MMKTDRIQAFSDGIFSILITILVLEFKLPDGYVQGNLLQAVLQQWADFGGLRDDLHLYRHPLAVPP
jgi:uncharacterized membrane protein